MRRYLLPAFAVAALAAPAPLLAQDAQEDAPQDVEAREVPFSAMAERMRDPGYQRDMALMLRTMSEVLLDLPLAPLMEAMGDVAGEEAPEVAPDATLRSMAPEADRVPEEIERKLPRALDAMGSMAEAFGTMLPALEQLAERMNGVASQPD